MADSDTTCLNCDAQLGGEYCADCGQRRTDRNPTFREFIAETFRELLDWDGKIPATIRALLARPGLLTEDFLAGRRARWISPLRVYLICSVTYFIANPLVARIAGRSADRPTAVSFVTDAGERVSLSDLTAEERDAIARSPIFSRLGAGRLERIEANSDAIGEIIVEAIPKAMFVLMPLFALLTWSLWRSGGARYPAHLYFALHLHAALFASLVLPRVTAALGREALTAGLGLIAVIYSTWYTGAAMKRVLGGTAGQLIGRGLVLGVVYSVAMLAVVLGIAVVAILQA